jgi:hypothetical protein
MKTDGAAGGEEKKDRVFGRRKGSSLRTRVSAAVISTFREFSKRGRVDWLVKTLVRKPSNPVNYGKFRDFEPYPG